MEGEFNNLTFDNTKTIDLNKINNIETSDELTAALMYQDKMGTVYSKRKKAARVVSATGIALLATAASIRTGTLISNAFVLNPPTVAINSCEVVDNTFKTTFKMTNKLTYKVSYFITVNSETIVNENCSEAKDYIVTFTEFKEGDACSFYIEFSNKVDYKTKLLIINFNTGGTDYDGNQKG